LAGVQQFEDLIAWQKARELSRLVYRLTNQGRLARDFRLSGQMQGAAVSVMSNIAQGFERDGDGEFYQFLKLTKSSCGEVRSLLCVALDANYIDEPTFEHLRTRADEVSRVVAGPRASGERRRSHFRRCDTP
jgi:four helix bundle protein